MDKYVVVLVVSEAIDQSKCKKRMLRQFDLLLRRLSRPGYNFFTGYDYSLSHPPDPQCGLVQLVTAGMPPYTSNPTEWHGGTIVVFVPLSGLKIDRPFIEKLFPLLRDPLFADRLGDAMLQANLGDLAKWLATQPENHRRTGVGAATHLHFGLSVGAEPNLAFFFSASAITEALGVVPRLPIELMLDFHGRLTRSDYPIQIEALERHPTKWNGDMAVKILLSDVQFAVEDIQRLTPLINDTTVWTDWLSEAVLNSHISELQGFVAALSVHIYETSVGKFAHRHFGFALSEDRQSIRILFHISVVREAFDYSLMAASVEGAKFL